MLTFSQPCRFMIALIAHMAFLSACDSLLNKSEPLTRETPAQVPAPNSENPTPSVVAASSSGSYTTAIKASASATQVVAFSDGKLAGASLTFPPGALAGETNLEVREGKTMATAETMASLNLGTATQVKSISSALTIEPSSGIDPKTPFSVSLPLGNMTLHSLTTINPDELAVVYQVKNFAQGGAPLLGILPPADLRLVDGTVSFAVTLFGSYQVVVATPPIKSRHEVMVTQTVVQAPSPAPLPLPAASPLPSAPAPAPAQLPTPAPTAPSNLGALTLARPAVTLSWEPVPAASSYTLYWSQNPAVDRNSQKITGLTGLSYTHESLTPGASYSYRLVAVGGGGESSWSNEVVSTLPPATPSDLSLAASGQTVTLSWPPAKGASTYNLYWSLSTPVRVATANKIAGVSSGYAHTNRAPGTTYYYALSAEGPGGESSLSTQASATLTPAPPASLTASANDATSVALAWAAVTGANSYNLYWSSTSPVTSASNKLSGLALNYNHTGRTPGATYHYRVTASGDNGESALIDASEQSVTMLPATPSNLAATSSGNAVTLSWSTAAAATSYNLYWSTSSPVTTTATKITGVSSPYTHTNLKPGTTYYYAIAASGAGGDGALTQEQTAAPLKLWAKPGYGRNYVSWASHPVATSYKVYWSTSSPVTTASNVLNAASSTYVHTALANGNTYYYRVEALANGQQLAWSSEVQAIPGGLAGPVCTDGNLRKFASDGKLVYMGGTFARVGRCADGFAAFDLSSAASTWLPQADGLIRTVISDGSGGWYVGGDFWTIAGQSRYGLAHLDSNGVVSAWNPSPDGYVSTLVLAGNALYVGGGFTTIDGVTRNFIAAFDTTTGSATSWDPNADGGVNQLILSGSDLYALGSFTSIGGQNRSGVALLDPASGVATAWDPSPNGGVMALVVSGTTVYVGGAFTNIGGANRNYIAALDSAGQATAWDPNADGNIRSLALAGSVLYAGGAYNAIGGATRYSLAAIDTTSGTATSWAPGIVTGDVASLAVASGVLYMAGSFDSVAGQTRHRLAALDASGNLLAWHPNAGRTGEYVSRISVVGSSLFASGTFSLVGALARGNAAAIDEEGNLTPWNPDANGTVASFALDSGNVYLGGDFTSLAGASRTYLALVDSVGTVSSWNPASDGGVYAIEAHNEQVLVGGLFTNIGGQNRQSLAALRSDATATGWAPEVNGTVQSMDLTGGTLYFAGDFTTVGNSARNRLAAVDADTGAVSNWDPDANGLVYSLVRSGSLFYLGGNFTAVGGQARNYLAAVSANGAVTAWNPGTNSLVTGLSVAGGMIYAVGCFQNIAGVSSFWAGGVDANGAATNWFPGIDGICSHAVYATPNAVYIGGTNSKLNGLSRSPAAVDLSTGVPVW